MKRVRVLIEIKWFEGSVVLPFIFLMKATLL